MIKLHNVTTMYMDHENTFLVTHFVSVGQMHANLWQKYDFSVMADVNLHNANHIQTTTSEVCPLHSLVMKTYRFGRLLSKDWILGSKVIAKLRFCYNGGC